MDHNNRQKSRSPQVIWVARVLDTLHKNDVSLFVALVCSMPLTLNPSLKNTSPDVDEAVIAIRHHLKPHKKHLNSFHLD